jgi:predicted Zn-ribbon and HTH transcriptional regulator
VARGQRQEDPAEVEDVVELNDDGSRKASDDDILVIQQVRVDKFNTLRKRVLLTPAVCRNCGVDFAAKLNLDPYHELKPEVQARLRSIVQEHVEKDHSISQLQAVRRGDLKRLTLSEQKR